MANPIRVQLRRTKGWKMPPNTVKVDRSTGWGNPYRIGEDLIEFGGQPAVRIIRGATAQQCVDAFRAEAIPHTRSIQQRFRGKNLACWCPLHRNGEYVPCHADVLLSLANDIPLEDVIRENLRRAEGEAAR